MARTDTLARLFEGRGPLLLFAIYLVVAGILYAPALTGPPISDDFLLLVNPWVIRPTPGTILALLDPTSEATRSLMNYAPVRPLLNMLQWWIHPQVAIAYHGLNVVLHCLASVLLAVLLESVGAGALPALLAATIFLVHPANVEAIAWMCQVWSPLCLIFSLLALLSLARRPGRATLWLVLALLTKPLAVFSVPVAATFAWCRTPSERDESPPRWGWLAFWALLAIAYSIAQVVAYGDTGPRASLHHEPAVAVRTLATYILRYLLMAYTSWGIAAFQTPPLSMSWTDPWFLAAAIVLLALGLRLLTVLRRRSPEAAGWVWALAVFAPVSQLYPFLYPIADRYLYLMLPGLLLATCFAGRDLLARVSDPPARAGLDPMLAILGLVVCLAFGVRSAERTWIWRSEDAVLADSARAYPEGPSSLLLRARRAGSAGDAVEAVALLRRASDQGWDYWRSIVEHPAFAPVRNDPRFQGLLADLAESTIEKNQRRSRLTQQDLSIVAEAHALRGEREAAILTLDQAIVRGGPLEAPLRARREALARSMSPR